jgi:hypothetical protein
MAGMSSPNSPTYTPSGTTPTAGGKGPAPGPSQYTPSPGGQYGVSSDALNRYSATNQGQNPSGLTLPQMVANKDIPIKAAATAPSSTGTNKGFKSNTGADSGAGTGKGFRSGGAVREISEKDIKQFLDALRIAREVVSKGK